MAGGKNDPGWVAKLRSDLQAMTKDELVETIIENRRSLYSKVGKRNVATSKAHERRCKKLLTDWSGVEFRRRRVEGRGDDVRVVEGVADVIPVEGDVIFAIESKKGKGFSINALFENPAGAVFTAWWHQVSFDALLLTQQAGGKRWPMLFFKPHQNWDWIAIPINLFAEGVLRPRRGVDAALSSGGCWWPHIIFDYSVVGPVEHNVSNSKRNKVMKELELESCVICRWQDFAINVDPKSIFVADSL